MQHKAYGQTDVGCVRDHNEDYILIDSELGLYVVCDGLGGHAAGEIASKLACSTIQQYIREHAEQWHAARGERPDVDRRDAAIDLTCKAIEAANSAIYKYSQTDPKFRGMGCTAVVLLMLDRCAAIGHVGDSRIYAVRGAQLFQLTEDHSWVDEQLKRGLITPEQARKSQDHSRITRAVGTRQRVDAEAMFFDLLSRDRFLLCSDGLTRHVDDADLTQYVDKAENEDAYDQLPQLLINLANKRGGYDNITALLINVEEVDQSHDNHVFRKFDVIKNMPLFKYFNYMETLKILSVTKLISFKPNQKIIRQGDMDQRLFLCVDGSVEVRKNNQAIAQLSKGDFFGEMSLLDKFPRSADVIALESSRLMCIERRDFLELVERERHLGLKILWKISRVLNQRLRDTSEDLAWSKVQVSDGPEDALREMAT
jgi:serine/threonine protein phosphatase PrpC